MQPQKLIRYAAITLVLFYFSTSHGFLDACPKRHSVTDKCYQQDDKYRDYRRSERRIADVLQRNEDLDRDTPRTDTGDGRMLDRNNNRITPQRDRFTSNDDRSTRFRSFNTISRRSDRMNDQRRNAGNSMQKPTLKARVFDERRLSRTHETEARRSRQPNSNEFSKQRRIREAEERIWNLERRNTRQEKNKEDTSGLRQTDRVLADHRTNKDDNRRSSIRDSDDRRHSPARSISRSGREEQISPVRNNRQTDRVLAERRRNVDNSRRSSVRNSDDRRRSPATRDDSPQSSPHLGSDSRREATTSRSGREERTPFVRADRRSSTRREIALPTFRRERDARNRDTFRLLQLERIPADHRRNVDDSRRSSVQDSGDRRSTRDYSRSGREEQDSRLSSIRCEDASSRSGREERASFACADRSSTRRGIALPNTSDASTFRRERDVKNRDTVRLRQLERIPADHRRNVDDSRRSSVQDSGDRRSTRDYSRSGREEQNSRLSSMRRDDASSRSGREERTSYVRADRRSSTRRETAAPRASIDSSTFRREERSSAARDSRQSSMHRQLSLPDVRRNVVYSRSTRQEPDGFGRKLLATDARRNTISSSSGQEWRESRQLTSRQLASFSSADDRLSSVRRERALSNPRLDATSSTSRLEERSSIARDNRQIVTPSDVRREARRISAARDRPQSSTRREHNLSNSRRNVESSWYRQKERSTRGNQQILTRRFSPAGVHDRRSSIRRELMLFNTFRREERPSLVHHERRLASANTLFRRETAFDRRESTHRDAASSRFREDPSRTSIHREDRRQSSAMMQIERRSVANHRELAEFDDRKQTSVRSHSSSSTSRADRRQSSIRRDLTGDGDRTRRSRSMSTSRTDEQRLMNRRLLEVSVGRRDLTSRRLLDEELHSSASFSEHAKPEAWDNFGYKLTSRIAKDWSNLANTLLIALTLFQILAKTYPKKVGFQNLLHNSLGCVKQKVQ